MTRNWRPLPDPPTHIPDVVAVDGSRAYRPFAGGSIVYVTRAVALWGRKRFRTLEADAFFPGTRARRVREFIGTKMEWQEFRAILKVLKEGGLSDGVILLDGSLYGRMLHLPRDNVAESHKGFMVTYFETYQELLETCLDRGVLLVGVSKESRASFLRELFLSFILTDELTRVKDKLDLEDQARILRLPTEILDRRLQAARSFKRLRTRYGELLDRLSDILSEVQAVRPDHQMIRNFVGEAGYSTPLQLGLHRGRQRLMRQLEKNPRRYAESNFSEAASEAEDSDSFLAESEQILSGIPKMPAIVSFHVLLDARDTPLRVDVPSSMLGGGEKLVDCGDHKAAAGDVTPILEVLVAGYGGLRNYNVWLKRVDEEVRLGRRTVDYVYTPALGRLLDLTLIHERGYRRVKYP